MSSPAGGYGAGPGTGADAHHHHQQHHGHTVLLTHAQHMAAAAAAASGGQLYHVPQHSRREKLRFPPDAAEDSPPTATPLAPHHHHHNHQAGAWPPPAFYSYASSSSSYSPHSPTAAQGQQQQQLVLNGLTAQQLTAQAQQLPQIPTQNFSLTLSSASSNPATTPPTPRRQQQQQLGGGPSPAAGPYGPFTGYPTVLGRSKFLGPAQKLLAEICDVGGAAAHVDRSSGPDEGLLDADPMDGADEDAAAIHELDTADAAGPMSGAEQLWKKTRLISMMEEVCKRYRQYYQQVQAVIASFESVAGFSNAAPFTALALRVMAKHFRCIKGMILNQLRNTSKMPVKEGMSKDITIFGLGGGAPAGGFQRGSSANGVGQPHNIWRPQRGLPERSVTVLRAWLFEHFLHPYPTDGDKQMLAKQTGLSRNQVSNWFINARVRLWKPMVEEIHNLEMRQYSLAHSPHDKGQQQHGVHGQATHQHSSQQRSGKRSEPCDSQPGQSSGVTRNHHHHSHSHPAPHGFPDELPQMSHSMQGQVSFAGYGGALPSQHQHQQQQHNGMASPQHHHHHVVGGGGGGNGGVSLTLGLHQNNRVCFGEPLPANLAHRFGLEDVSDPYVFGGQDRHFAKEIGGHLLHDFVG